MRLFAAVLPPVEAVQELARAVGRLRELPGADELRWTERTGWHFTIAFMGEVEEGLIPELAERLGRAAHRTEPFSLRIRGGGHFGERALWAGAADGALGPVPGAGEGDAGVDGLRLLAARADAAARRAGVPMEEEHPHYRPHLTLARNRGADAGLRAYADELSGFEGAPWVVAELALVRSVLPVSGVPGEQPRYETVLRCPLGRARTTDPGDGSAARGR
ncbi:2'-5' RNA ligase family protein [Streptomyces sp. NPDC088400]|uniref:2'-5' RNA ligase family protein n=1 Tax=Streptomyces sp. NPDC088400 TaxID=3365861 RepID=UPI0037F20B53